MNTLRSGATGGGRTRGRKPVIRQVRKAGAPVISQAAPKRRRVVPGRPTKPELAAALYDLALANAQATTGGLPGEFGSVSGFSEDPAPLPPEAPLGHVLDDNHAGLRFNPNYRLDPSQVQDRRGDLPEGYDPREPINAVDRAWYEEAQSRFPGSPVHPRYGDFPLDPGLYDEGGVPRVRRSLRRRGR